MPLNDKQERFCQEYIKDLNATQAAIRADYSEKTAGSQGQRLLKNVEIEKRILELKGERSERTKITQDMVIAELANVAFANIGLVCDWNEEGSLILKSKEDICAKGIAALQSVQSLDSFDKDGNKLTTRNSFRMHDKLKALELLAKHLGILDGSSGDNSSGDASDRLSQALRDWSRRGS